MQAELSRLKSSPSNVGTPPSRVRKNPSPPPSSGTDSCATSSTDSRGSKLGKLATKAQMVEHEEDEEDGDMTEAIPSIKPSYILNYCHICCCFTRVNRHPAPLGSEEAQAPAAM